MTWKYARHLNPTEYEVHFNSASFFFIIKPIFRPVYTGPGSVVTRIL